MIETVKYCGGCDQRKPLDAFAKHRYMADGRQPRCRACAKAYSALWRAAHPGYQAQWRAANPLYGTRRVAS